MRVRYTKPGGKEVDLPEGAARRLIASGQAEAVDAERPAAREQAASVEEPAAPRPAAKKTSARSR